MMKPSDKKKENTAKKLKCGVITCIHRALDTCTLDACEMQERTLLQES